MPRPRSDIHPRIIEAARARFLIEGVDGSSLRTIAKDANTSIGMIYYYFPSKDDLLFAVVEDVYEGLLGDLRTALDPQLPAEERVTRLYARIGCLSAVEFDVVRILIRELLVSSERLHRLLERLRRGHLPLVVDLAASGQRDQVFRADLPLPVLILSLATCGAVPQLLRRVALEHAPELATQLPDGDALAALMKSVVFLGVLAQPNKGEAPDREANR
ncbi:MAG: TetR/AcrR family transcriptional regulator [Myxococcales bacterium]|nr:TetR/AcrR family transcriptional regulator [Myxococcales bacterium]